jgi:hypothetical protein
MGTNYYRIPTAEEMEERRERLKARVIGLKLEPDLIERGFHYIEIAENSWEYHSPWSEFLEDTRIHLGKRSMGGKFLWNWNDEKFYKNKEDLFRFIRSGRVVNEYGEVINQEEFIQMALDWGKEDGWDLNTYYEEKGGGYAFESERDHERYVDDLRVSTCTDFS